MVKKSIKNFESSTLNADTKTQVSKGITSVSHTTTAQKAERVRINWSESEREVGTNSKQLAKKILTQGKTKSTSPKAGPDLAYTKKPIYTSYSKSDNQVKLVTIGLASATRIRQWAEKTLPNGKVIGEVTNANTLHHKTFKPQKGGLFCERIFGPLKDFKCACTTSKKSIAIKANILKDLRNNSDSAAGSDRGVLLGLNPKRYFCPKCDVEYTWSVMRRYQLGYIKLNAPVTHVWYLKGNPSYLSLLLDMKKKHAEHVTYSIETLTLEHSLKGDQLYTLADSPKAIFEAWQKVTSAATHVDTVGLISDKTTLGPSSHSSAFEFKAPKLSGLPKSVLGSELGATTQFDSGQSYYFENAPQASRTAKRRSKSNHATQVAESVCLGINSAEFNSGSVNLNNASKQTEQSTQAVTQTVSSLQDRGSTGGGVIFDTALYVSKNLISKYKKFFLNSKNKGSFIANTGKAGFGTKNKSFAEPSLSSSLPFTDQQLTKAHGLLLNFDLNSKKYTAHTSQLAFSNSAAPDVGKNFGNNSLILQQNQTLYLQNQAETALRLNSLFAKTITLNSFAKKEKMLSAQTKPYPESLNWQGSVVTLELVKYSMFLLKTKKEQLRKMPLLVSAILDSPRSGNQSFLLINAKSRTQKKQTYKKIFKNYNPGFKLILKSIVKEYLFSKTLNKYFVLPQNQHLPTSKAARNVTRHRLLEILKWALTQPQVTNNTAQKVQDASNIGRNDQLNHSTQSRGIHTGVTSFAADKKKILLAKLLGQFQQELLTPMQSFNLFEPKATSNNLRGRTAQDPLSVVTTKNLHYLNSFFLVRLLYQKNAHKPALSSAALPISGLMGFDKQTTVRRSITKSVNLNTKKKTILWDLAANFYKANYCFVSPNLEWNTASFADSVIHGPELNSLSDNSQNFDYPTADQLSGISGGACYGLAAKKTLLDLWQTLQPQKFGTENKQPVLKNTIQTIASFYDKGFQYKKNDKASIRAHATGVGTYKSQILQGLFINRLILIVKKLAIIQSNCSLFTSLLGTSIPNLFSCVLPRHPSSNQDIEPRTNPFVDLFIPKEWADSQTPEWQVALRAEGQSSVNNTKNPVLLTILEHNKISCWHPHRQIRPSFVSFKYGATRQFVSLHYSRNQKTLKDYYYACGFRNETTFLNFYKPYYKPYSFGVTPKLKKYSLTPNSLKKYRAAGAEEFIQHMTTQKAHSQFPAIVNGVAKTDNKSLRNEFGTVKNVEHVKQEALPNLDWNSLLVCSRPKTLDSKETTSLTTNNSANCVSKHLYSSVAESRIVNNLYCFSHRELWDQEKDWLFFSLYYFSSQIVDDIVIPCYAYRNYDFSVLNTLFTKEKIAKPTRKIAQTGMSSSGVEAANSKIEFGTRGKPLGGGLTLNLQEDLNVSFSGAGMIKTLLAEYDYFEMKKMDKQNRILLFDINKYILALRAGRTKNSVVSRTAREFSSVTQPYTVIDFSLAAREVRGQTLKKSPSETARAKSIEKELREACKQRDALIRRTKLIRKLFKNYNNQNLLNATYNLQNNLQSRAYEKGASTSSKSKVSIDTELNSSNTSFTEIILTVLPVLPPDLRPIVQMGNQVAASDLNRLYQRVIYRNDRLKKFLKDPTTNGSYEMKYAQRLLQEAVDNLIQNGKSGVVPEKDARGRALKSLTDLLKGKQGRFRQFLLGKRVDYSGRSVIVVGPRLKLNECGIPKEMALELYLPFLIKRILSENFARTVVGAKALIQHNKPLTWFLLREIMKTCPVLLNRAPTLHRLGFQAFQPKLVDGRAILLHPLVCPAFNADFDGDQMAVHIPISAEARAEAWKLMLSRNNLLSPATGEPLVLPSQDMVLGCYYLTTHSNSRTQKHSLRTQKGYGQYFDSFNDVLKAYQLGLVNVHTIVWVKWNGRFENANDLEQPLELRINRFGYSHVIYSKSQTILNNNTVIINRIVKTTPGKIFFNFVAFSR